MSCEKCAEVAAAVSEAQAEAERMRAQRDELDDLIDELRAERGDADSLGDAQVREVAEVERLRQEIDECWVPLYHGALNDAKSAEAEVERLREGIRALADARDVKYPERFQFAAGDNHVAGYRQAQAALRALLAPSPAATTSEADGAWLHEADGTVCPEQFPLGHRFATREFTTMGDLWWCTTHQSEIRWTPAPVSSGEAGTGEAVRRLQSCVEAWPDCYEGGYNPSCCRFPKSCSCDVYDPERVADEDLEP